MTGRKGGVTEQAASAAIEQGCRMLRLPTIRERFGEVAAAAQREQLTYLGFLAELVMAECDDRDKRRAALFWIMAVVVLGATFLGFQSFEFTHFYHEGASLQKNLFGSTFFVLTGFHGAHVTVGVMWLLALWFDTLRGRIRPENALRLEIAGLYWHFVDVVWIAIFTLVYLIS